MPTKAGEEHVLRFRLTCIVRPPESHEGRATEFGLQDKRRVLHPGETQPDGSIQYDFEVPVRRAPAGAPRFGGPFVHGTPAEPFLYLGWRRADGPPAAWIRRTKILLTSITWSQIFAAGDTGGLLAGCVAGIEGSRAPLLDDGWAVQPRDPSGS